MERKYYEAKKTLQKIVPLKMAPRFKTSAFYKDRKNSISVETQQLSTSHRSVRCSPLRRVWMSLSYIISKTKQFNFIFADFSTHIFYYDCPSLVWAGSTAMLTRNSKLIKRKGSEGGILRFSVPSFLFTISCFFISMRSENIFCPNVEFSTPHRRDAIFRGQTSHRRSHSSMPHSD